MLRQFDTLGIHLLARRALPLVAAVVHNGSVQPIEWSRAPYTIACCGKRTDWSVLITSSSVPIPKGRPPRHPIDPEDTMRIRLWISQQKITQIPLTLPPLCHQLGPQEWFLVYTGARIYEPESGDWFGGPAQPTPS
jgi:hypothetical protein